MEKRWVVKEQGDLQLIRKLSQELNIDESLANLLVQRGISSLRKPKLFFVPA